MQVVATKEKLVVGVPSWFRSQHSLYRYTSSDDSVYFFVRFFWSLCFTSPGVHTILCPMCNCLPTIQQLCTCLQSVFNKCFSQKIRHIRLDRKSKSQGPSPSQAVSTKKPCFRTVDDSSSQQPGNTSVSAEDTKRNVSEICISSRESVTMENGSKCGEMSWMYVRRRQTDT